MFDSNWKFSLTNTFVFKLTRMTSHFFQSTNYINTFFLVQIDNQIKNKLTAILLLVFIIKIMQGYTLWLQYKGGCFIQISLFIGNELTYPSCSCWFEFCLDNYFVVFRFIINIHDCCKYKTIIRWQYES